MAYVVCDECGKERDEVVCMECYNGKIAELEGTIDDLSKEIEDLKDRLQQYEK